MRKFLKGVATALMAVVLSVTCLGATSALADEATTAYDKTVVFNGVATGDTVTAYRLISYGDNYNTYVFENSFKTYLKTYLNESDASDGALASEIEKLTSEQARLMLKGYVNGWNEGNKPNVYKSMEKNDSTTSPSITFGPGFYLVLPSTTTDNSKLYNPLSVFVKVEGNESTIAAADQSASKNTSISVEMKSEYGPVLNKYVQRNSDGLLYSTKTVEVGDEVTYVVKISFPDYTNYGDPEFVLHDTMSALVYDNDIKVYEGKSGSDNMYDDAKEIVGAVSGTPAYDSATGKLEVKLDYSKFASEQDIYVVYKAKVSQAITGSFNSDHALASINEAYLSYRTTAQSETSKTNVSSTSVYTYALDLAKVNGTVTPLTGAKFKISEVKGNANPEQLYFKLVKDASGNSYYVIVSKGTEGATDIVEAAAGSDGNHLMIRGLDQFNDYLVEEVEVPKGYYAPAGKFRIKMSSLQTENGEHTGKLKNEDCSLTAESDADNALVGGNKSTNGAELVVQLKNSNMPSLPTTGGMGTALFTIGGVALMAVAAVAFVVIRRKSDEK